MKAASTEADVSPKAHTAANAGARLLRFFIFMGFMDSFAGCGHSRIVNAGLLKSLDFKILPRFRQNCLPFSGQGCATCGTSGPSQKPLSINDLAMGIGKRGFLLRG
jgi:hypothetical protein